MQAHTPIAPTVPIRYVAEMCVRAPRAVVQRALRRAGIAERSAWAAGFRVTGAQTLTVYETIVRETEDELFGAMRKPVPRGSYATLVRMLTRVRDIAMALDATIDFFTLFDGHAPWRIEIAAGAVVLSLAPRTATQSSALLF